MVEVFYFNEAQINCNRNPASILTYSSNILADTHKFPDVPVWADKSVNYLVDKQVLNGYPDGTFGSNDSLDRASATKIMTKVLGYKLI